MPSFLWLGITVLLYVMAEVIYKRFGRRPYVHPTLTPSLVLITLLSVREEWYTPYVEGTAVLGVLLSTTVVALALPLYRNFSAIKQQPLAVLIAIGGGSFAGVATALVAAHLLASPPDVMASLASKSVTSPIAISIAQSLNGIPAVAAFVVLMTGVVAAVWGPAFLRLLGVDDELAVGFAMGTAGHAFGMAAAVRRSDLMGAAAAFAMAFNGLMTAFILPLIWPAITAGF